MNPIMMIPNLPHSPPFVPQVDCRPNMADQVKLITGYLMQEIQSKAMADRSFMANMYNFVGYNGYQNTHFIQLVQEVTTIIDYLISQCGEDFNSVIQKVIPSSVLSVAATLAQQNPQIMASLPANVQTQMGATSQHYLQLLKTADNWLKGAKMQQYQPQQYFPGQPQQLVNQFGQPIMAPQGYPQQPAVGYPPQAAVGYPQQPAVGYPAQGAVMQPQMNPQQQAAAYYQQQAYAAQQQQALAAQQQQAYAAQQQNQMRQNQAMGQHPQGYVPQVANNQPYVPQVAGSPFAAPQTQQTSGPRQGGLGSVGIMQPEQTPEQQAYVPQAAATGVAMSPSYQQPSGIQPQAPAPAAAAVMQPQAPINYSEPTVTAQAISPKEVSNATNLWVSKIPEGTLYRCLGRNNSITRLPYVFDVTKEAHLAVISNGVVVEQKVESKGDTVELSEHETIHYFPARTVADHKAPDVTKFTTALDKTLEVIELDKILNEIEALQDPDEESLERATAGIIKTALAKTVRITKPVLSVATNYRREIDQMLDEKLKISTSKDNITARHVKVMPWSLSGELSTYGSRVTLSPDLESLHRNFAQLINRLPPEKGSPLVDEVSAVVNRELTRYFGLKLTVDSFVLDFHDLMEAITKRESVEFASIVAKHIHERLTQTILYAYTPEELAEVCGKMVIDDPDARVYAIVKEVMLLPVRSHDVPYAYNGKAGLLLNTEYPSLTRMIDSALERSSPHTDELLVITLDDDIMRISPILNDNCFVMYK